MGLSGTYDPDARRLRPARRVQQVREKAGLTRIQLAVQAGVSPATLYMAERGGLLSDAVAAKISRVLGCTAEDLR